MNLEILLKTSLLALLLTVPTAWADKENTADELDARQSPGVEASPESSGLSQQELQFRWARDFWYSLNRQKGRIGIADGVATLDVPAAFYFLGPEDSERVLTEAWGNPPGSGVLGMLFPEGMTPFDSNIWAVTIKYNAGGHVPDDDAGSIDYDELLKQMQADAVEETRLRQEQGYESIEIVGWALKPVYDKATHKFQWAREIGFGSLDSNTLHYNILALGRKGVLLFDFVADINQKTEVENSLDSVLAMPRFNPGYRYDDFNPETDEVAAYGIASLIAGKSGL